jgi:multiple sugar transport system substrate-binding protein
MKHTLSRRSLVVGGTALPLLPLSRPACARQATPAPSIAGTTLRILMPRHPLASYDDAIRSLATSWGTNNQVIIDLAIVSPGDIPATLDAELEIGSGHDLIGFTMPLIHRAADLHDLTGLHDIALAQFGPPSDTCDIATRLADGARPAFAISYAPAPLIYRRSIWERYGLPDGPTTWDQVHETGAQIWNGEGMNLGLGLAPEPGSERFAQMLIAAHGGAMLDDTGEITINSPETIAAVRFAVTLFRDAMSPESLDWDRDRPARLLAEGIASLICDDISSLRLAQARNQEIANDLFLAPPPAGPATNLVAALPPSSIRSFHIPLFATNPDAAQAFVLMLVESSESLAGASQLADRPAYGSLVPGMFQDGGWLDTDPYGSVPAEKLSMLRGSAAWTSWPGAPSPPSALASRAQEEFLLSRMMASAARGDATPEEAVADAESWFTDRIS